MEEKQKLNLVQKLAKIRDGVGAVARSKKGYGYTYADITDILAGITGGMKRYGVSLAPQISPGTMQVSQNVITDNKIDKTGNAMDIRTTEMLVSAEMIFRWINDEHPEEFIDVPWVIVGAQKDPSQAFGSALTYCTRYFLTSYFEIALDNDVDGYRSKQKEAEEAEEREIIRGMVETIDTLVKKYQSDYPDKRDALIRFAKRYEKSGDYLKIKSPELLAKMIQDFKSQFLAPPKATQAKPPTQPKPKQPTQPKSAAKVTAQPKSTAQAKAAEQSKPTDQIKAATQPKPVTPAKAVEQPKPAVQAKIVKQPEPAAQAQAQSKIIKGENE